MKRIGIWDEEGVVRLEGLRHKSGAIGIKKERVSKAKMALGRKGIMI